jgi:hypothetical protein
LAERVSKVTGVWQRSKRPIGLGVVSQCERQRKTVKAWPLLLCVIYTTNKAGVSGLLHGNFSS